MSSIIADKIMDVSGAPLYPSAAAACIIVTGGTPTLNGASGMSSITDNGPGDYTLGFSPAMQHNTYCLNGTVCQQSANNNTNPVHLLVKTTAAEGSVPTLMTTTQFTIITPQKRATGMSDCGQVYPMITW